MNWLIGGNLKSSLFWKLSFIYEIPKLDKPMTLKIDD
jgi:hypothetical protein